MEILLIVFMLIAMFGILLIYKLNMIEYFTHIEMVKYYAKMHNYMVVKGNFETFHNEIGKRVWRRNTLYPESFFIEMDINQFQEKVFNAKTNEEAERLTTEYEKNYVHASVICFNGVGIILDYKSWVKFNQFIKYYKSEQNTYNWNLNDYEY